MNGLDAEAADQLFGNWRVSGAEKGASIISQGDLSQMEYIILSGCVTSQISDPEGRSVCIGFHKGPCVVTPNVARTKGGLSLVSLDVHEDALIAQMNANNLSDLMLASEPIRNWGNIILQKELARKADREWCLAALGGADRLLWFRKTYPYYEMMFGHSLIASFLGVTPVTFSRLRGAAK
jgi:CRP-like cAMP-binding protein